MSWLQHMPLSRKVLLINLLSMLLLAAILGSMIWNSLEWMMVENLEKRGAEIGQHVASLSADYILTEDYYAIYNLISQTLEANEDIRYIVILDNQNQLISHTFTNGIPKGILQLPINNGDAKYSIAVLSSEEGLIHDLLVPIENGSVGFVRVGMSERNMKDFIAKKMNQLMIATVLVCGLVAVILLLIMMVIVKPIESLVQVAARIRDGDLAIRAQEGSRDEIGELAKTFNRMTDSLIAQKKEQEKLLISREALLKQLQERDQLRNILINKLMTAQEDERKRISRELHDETSQGITSLMVAMRVLADDADSEAQREALLASRNVAEEILQGIREMAVDLRPPALDELGLVSAIRKYVDKFSERHSIKLQLEIEHDEMPIPVDSSVALYRILQEGLNNIIKHSKATTIIISLSIDNGLILLCIRDNGRGISPEIIEKARKKNRLGLYGMQERAELMGGIFSIIGLPGQGTEIKVVLPLHPEI